MRVARPKWTPQTKEQRQAIAAVAKAAERATLADAQLWDAVASAHALDVPPAFLAEALGVSRGTIYRHLPTTEDPDRSGE